MLMTEEELIGKIGGWRSEAEEAHERWRKNAEENLGFYLGGDNQWDPEALKMLDDEGRPHLSINKIKGRVRLILGYLDQNALDWKIRPIGPGADNKIANVIGSVLHHIKTRNFGDMIDAMVMSDAVITGRGWWCARLSYDENVFGEVELSRYPPQYVMIDPFTTMPDLRDCSYVLVSHFLTQREIENMFPDYGKKIDFGLIETSSEFAADFRKSRTGSPADHRYNLREVWYRDNRYEVVAVNIMTGEIHPVPADDERSMNDALANENLKVLRRQVSGINFAYTIGHDVPWHQASPYSNKLYPLTPCMPMALNTEEALETPSIVDDMKDPQREKNKRRSQALHIINTSAHSGWIMEDGAVDDKRVLERFGSKPGIVIVKNPGKKLEQIKPQPIPQAIMAMEEQSDRDFGDVTLLHDSMVGMPVERESGRALRERKMQGLMSLSDIDRGYRFGKTQQGRVVLDMVQRHYKGPRTFWPSAPTTGEKEFGEFSINGVNPDDPSSGTINDITVGKYDVMVDVSPSSPTHRLMNLSAYLEMLQYKLPVPPDVLIDAMDVPERDEIKRRFAEHAARLEQAGPTRKE